MILVMNEWLKPKSTTGFFSSPKRGMPFVGDQRRLFSLEWAMLLSYKLN